MHSEITHICVVPWTNVPVTLQQQMETIIKVYSPADYPSKMIYGPDKPPPADFIMDVTNEKKETRL